MKEFSLEPINWKRTYYPNPKTAVSFVEENDEVYSTTTNYFLTKTTSYTNEEKYREDIDNLKRLREDKFKKIKIPQYTFEASDMTIQYTCQYLKGYKTEKNDMIKLYDDLVLRESEYTFADYNIMNFITVNHPELSGVYAIDLTSYKKVSMELRTFLWDKYHCIHNPTFDHNT